MRFQLRILRLSGIVLALAISASVCAQQTPYSPTSPCSRLPHGDHPKVVLSNGSVVAVIFLPDAVNGYYRASRFDWAGVIGCLSYKNHTYFGEWFSHYDGIINDSITGPVEEFRRPQSEIGYDEAAAGGEFLKIGVGVLRRIDGSAYAFGTSYPIVDIGKRTIHRSGAAITFTQVVHTSFGYAYKYQKTVVLDKHGAVLRLQHKLTNIGAKTIDTAVYDHDFFMLDNQITGPGFVVHLGFPPTPDKPFPSSATINGNDIVFHEPTSPSPQAYLTGYKNQIDAYRITVEDTNAHVAVEQTSTSPISRFYFWSTLKTVCPEAYIAIHVAPGQTQSWAIQYRFKAP